MITAATSVSDGSPKGQDAQRLDRNDDSTAASAETQKPSPIKKGAIEEIAAELIGFHDCMDGTGDPGDGRFRIVMNSGSDGEQQRLNLRAVLRDAASLLATLDRKHKAAEAESERLASDLVRRIEDVAHLSSNLEETQKERDEARATVAAWDGAVGALKAHIMDRAAMNDPASPTTYLRILENDIRDLPRDAARIYAASQHFANSAVARAEAAEARLTLLQNRLQEVEGALEETTAVLEEICEPRKVDMSVSSAAIWARSIETVRRARALLPKGESQ